MTVEDGRVDKAIRVVGVSETSWEDAARSAVREVARTVRDLRTARVGELDVRVTAGGGLVYRAVLEVVFRVDRVRVTASGARVEVRRYLVVADETLDSDELARVVDERRSRGPCEFHVLVPCAQPAFGAGLVVGDPLSGYVGPSAAELLGPSPDDLAAAEARLASFLARVGTPDLPATGEVGVADPLHAVLRVLHRATFDEILLSTLPSTVSRWLRLDLPSRLRRSTPTPVTVVEAAAR